MTDSELFFEFIVALVEIGLFVLVLAVEAVILEAIYPKLLKIARRIAVRVKIRNIKKRIIAGIKVQSGINRTVLLFCIVHFLAFNPFFYFL